MLKVTVVDADNKWKPVRAGQVRRGVGGIYGLVVTDDDLNFNVIKLSDDDGPVDQFETFYFSFVSDCYQIQRDFPEVIDAELMIKGA